MEKTPKSRDKIRFTDCDMFGHLNNSRYLDYLINAREDHLKDFYNFDFNQYYRNPRYRKTRAKRLAKQSFRVVFESTIQTMIIPTHTLF